MPRRKIDLSTSGKGNVLDMKTGKPIEKPVLPVICERIKFYREQRGLEQKEFARMIGITPNTISNWENGRTRPDINLLPNICDALNISFYDLFNLDDPTIKYTAKEQTHLERYNHLNEGHKFAVDQMIENLIQVEEVENCPDIKLATYCSKRLAAGIGDPSEIEDNGEPIYLYSSPEVDKTDYVFTVNGDSMEPDYHSGQMVLVQSIANGGNITEGDIGAFMVGNETYIKEYREDGLYSHNEKYKPMHFDENTNVYLIGVVLGTLDPKGIASKADVERYEAVYGKPE